MSDIEEKDVQDNNLISEDAGNIEKDDSSQNDGDEGQRGEDSYRRGYQRDSDDNRSDRRPPYRGRGKVYFKRKVCKFCTQKIVADYKNSDLLRKFVTERGKILPRRITGTCAKHQRALATHIKRARVLAYLPFVKQ